MRTADVVWIVTKTLIVDEDRILEMVVFSTKDKAERFILREMSEEGRQGYPVHVWHTEHLVVR